jgi:hypothetical protein
VSGVLGGARQFARDLAVPTEILIEMGVQSAKSPPGAIEQRPSTEILIEIQSLSLSVLTRCREMSVKKACSLSPI